MQELSKESKAYLKSLVAGLSDQDALAVAAKAIASDFRLYCERNLMIKDKDTGRVIPFTLNWAQERLLNEVLDDLSKGIPVRYIILKARQLGISTFIEALGYWFTATNKNKSSVIVAHETDAARGLYEMFRRFYENSDPVFQPSLKYNTKSDLTFDVSDDVKQSATAQGIPIPGLASRINTAVAKDGGGRGGTNHFFHGSEVAFWDDSADTVSGILQTVPMAPGTFVFLESTANGLGSYFANEWFSAERGESSLKPFFLPWYEHNGYELDENLGVGPYDEYETEIVSLLTKKGFSEVEQRRKIAWSRRKRLEFRTDPKKFVQEYPHTPLSAFLSSGNYAFPVDKIMELEEIAVEKKYELIELTRKPDRKVEPKLSQFSPLKVWYRPQHGMKYVVGGDVAEGIVVSTATKKEGDYSVATVIEVESQTVVARWRGHIDPDLFGDVMFDLGTWYNNALLAPEVNNHGIVVLQKLINLFYRNLYRRETSEELQFQTPTATMGWKTTSRTKPLIIKELAQAYREEEIRDYDLVSLGESKTYMHDDRGTYGGKSNGHDDCVMSTAIALHMAHYLRNDVEYAQQNINKNSSRVIKKHGKENRNSEHDGIASKRRSLRSATRARLKERRIS